jgi:hypothetical protein
MALFDDNTSRRADRDHQVDIDFNRAINKAFIEELKGFLFRKSHRLLPFDQVKEKLELSFTRELGLQTVPTDQIVGSEGRYRSFTRQFLPLQEDLRERWKKVNQARCSGRNLPPVELYKVCNAYFVKDGHHRVSVARSKGSKYIEALVYEYECDVPLEKDTDLEKLAVQESYHQFLKATRLRKYHPEVKLQLTLFGGYPILMEHIQVHQSYLEQGKNSAVSFVDAANSWYQTVYLPLIDIIKKSRIMKQFPHRTETDFYLWIIENRRQLRKELGRPEEAETLVELYSRKYDRGHRKIIAAFKRFFGLVRYR